MSQPPAERSNRQGDADTLAQRPDARRRRLIVGGAYAPIVLTVASRPAWAGGDVCTPSALASADLSGRHEFEGCSKSSDYWMNSQDVWPESVSPDADFISIFGEVRYKGKPVFNDLTLGQVIGGQSDDTSGTSFHVLGQQTVGAYLNAHAFPGYFAFTAEQVVAAFNALALAGYNPQQLVTECEALAATFGLANNAYNDFTEWF